MADEKYVGSHSYIAGKRKDQMATSDWEKMSRMDLATWPSVLFSSLALTSLALVSFWLDSSVTWRSAAYFSA